MTNETGLSEARLHAKLRQCPHCKQTGHLIGHGYARGYAEGTSERVIRGQRLCCGKRNRHQGCGRTLGIWLATTLPRRVLRTATLARMLRAGLDGVSRKAGWECADIKTVTLRHLYRVWTCVEHAQGQLREALAGCCAPPHVPTASQPLAQLQAHLHHTCAPAIAAAVDVMASFALQFQNAALR